MTLNVRTSVKPLPPVLAARCGAEWIWVWICGRSRQRSEEMMIARGSASLNASHLFPLPALSKPDYTKLNESPFAFCKRVRIKWKIAGTEFIHPHSPHMIHSPD